MHFCKESSNAYLKILCFISVPISCDGTFIVHTVKSMSLGKQNIPMN